MRPLYVTMGQHDLFATVDAPADFLTVHRIRRLIWLKPAAIVLVLVLAACSASDPRPSRLFDGHYVGTRRSNQTEACGISNAGGTTSASVANGHLSIPLFGPRAQLVGTVGEDGRIRASGWWPNPTGGFPGMTVLNGFITGDKLEGHASDFRCETDVQLHKAIGPGRAGRPRTR